MDAQKIIAEVVEVLKNNGVDGIQQGGLIEIGRSTGYLRDGIAERQINIRLTQVTPMTEEEIKKIQRWEWSIFG